MKKIVMTIFSLLIVISMVGLAGCSSTSGTASTTSSPTTAGTLASGTVKDTAASSSAPAASTAGTGQKVFTLDELKTYNGQNGNPAYVAVNGTVYDVTNVKAWANGSHQGLTAGQDLSSAIGSSPHGTSVLDGLTIVGTLG